MEISVSSRHDEVDNELKMFARAQVESIIDHSIKVTSAKVVLDTHGKKHTAEVVINMKGGTIEADDETFSMKDSINSAVAKAEAQIARKIDKMHDHRKKGKLPQIDNDNQSDNEYDDYEE